MAMVPGVALAALVYVFLNEVRYHTIWDVGLNYIPNIHPDPRWGFCYLSTNLKTLLWMTPKFDGVFPYMHPHFVGQGLIWTSPAFVLALRGKKWLMGLCALLVAAPMLLVWANGFSQFGCRHFVPMFPFLIVVMAQRPLGLVGKTLIWMSVFLVSFGIWSVHRYGLVAPW